MSDNILASAHSSDSHLTDARERDFADPPLIAAQIEVEGAGLLDFVASPGDVAVRALVFGISEPALVL